MRAERRVKICGVTRAQDAALACSLGAWAVGMIFWPQSRRAVTVSQAARVAMSVSAPTLKVGVFVNPSLREVTEAARGANLSILQFHGEEDPQFCEEASACLGLPWIKALRGARALDQSCDRYLQAFALLLDAEVPGEYGGTGVLSDWKCAAQMRALAPKHKLILSGGLNPGNVARAWEEVQPYALDLSSGVEASPGIPGIKDELKMRALFAALSGREEGRP